MLILRYVAASTAMLTLLVPATATEGAPEGVEQNLLNSASAVTEAANSMPPFRRGGGLNDSEETREGLAFTQTGVATFSPGSKVIEVIDTTFGQVFLKESSGQQPSQFIGGKFLAFFALGTLTGPPQPNGDIETTFVAAGFQDTIRQATFQNSVVAQSDPYLGRTLRVTNPLDEGVVYRFETSLDIDALDSATTRGEALFTAEVLDTGGDAGAHLTYNVGHTLRQVDSGDRLSVGLNFSGSITEGVVDTLSPSVSGIGLGEDFDEILVSAFLTLSPGDTAVVTSIASFGDNVMPLIAPSEIAPVLDFVDDFASNFEGIPEPSSVLLLIACTVSVIASRKGRTAAASF